MAYAKSVLSFFEGGNMLTVPPFFEGLVFEVLLGDGREKERKSKSGVLGA